MLTLKSVAIGMVRFRWKARNRRREHVCCDADARISLGGVEAVTAQNKEVAVSAEPGSELRDAFGYCPMGMYLPAL